jgi:hypothetical protein
MALLTGHGRIYNGSSELGEVDYLVHLATNGQGTLVELTPRAHVRDGAMLHLVLQDGRFLLCQNIDHSQFCAVVGDGPNIERRQRPQPEPKPRDAQR